MVYKSKKSTKDGRQYFFRIKYKDIFWENHDYTSQKFKNLKEAQSEEAKYGIKINNRDIYTNNITFLSAWLELRQQKSRKFKKLTLLKNDNLFILKFD